MLRRFSLLFCLLWLAALPARADYVAGVRAWGRGDFATAAREFLPAAQAGNAEAQFMMGRLHSLGDGVPEDWTQAWAWFDRAARQGHDEARLARDGLQAILTPAQLAAARAILAPPRAQIALAVPPSENRQVVLVPRTGAMAPLPRSGTMAPLPSQRPIGPPASLTAPGATEEGRLMAMGGGDDPLRRVQRGLNRAGYDAGPVDGMLGPRTRQAIRAWQIDHGQPVSGFVTPDLLAGLGASEEPQQAAR